MMDQEVAQLAEKNPDLRKLLDQHQRLDARVDALNKRRVRTSAEELERKQLAKEKLASRDQIARQVARLKAAAK